MLPSSTIKENHKEKKLLTGIRRKIPNSSCLILFVSTLLLLLLISSNGGRRNSLINSSRIQTPIPQIVHSDPCSGRYIYIHRIPSRFNSDLLQNCSSLNKYIHMCKYIVNGGFGPPLVNDSFKSEIFSGGGWYWTNQFSLEIIFHQRMKRYECLTNNSSKASAVFVPYYAGLDVSRYLWNPNFTLRDAGSVDLAQWLRSTPEWSSTGGSDHFIIAGRVASDFRRNCSSDFWPNGSPDWGNRLMLLPESKNMTFLTIETSTAPNSTDLGIPYPTWFHPSGDDELRRWQDLLRQKERPYLFSFGGAPRTHLSDSMIRSELIDQCKSSAKCNLLLCEYGTEKCDDPERITRLFQSSIFCLQPPGDTLTRRSAFDCMLAGCIPVFFHQRSAYLQYRWHFPEDHRRYSIFIALEDVKSGEVSVEEKLSAIPVERVEAMREEVLRLIPKIVYADLESKKRGRSFEDAFDLAVKGVLERINGFRRDSGLGL